MSYQQALEAAGATVVAFESFGSYQGEWWASVVTKDGRSGWIGGSFGSCSGCDAFEAEFGWGGDENCEAHKYSDDEAAVAACDSCATARNVYNERLAAFGQTYLSELMTQEAAEAAAAREASWDMEADKMVAFLKEHAIASIEGAN